MAHSSNSKPMKAGVSMGSMSTPLCFKVLLVTFLKIDRLHLKELTDYTAPFSEFMNWKKDFTDMSNVQVFA